MSPLPPIFLLAALAVPSFDADPDLADASPPAIGMAVATALLRAAIGAAIRRRRKPL